MLVIVMLHYKVLTRQNRDDPVDKDLEKIHGINYQEIIIGVESLVALFCCFRYASKIAFTSVST